MNLKSRPPSSGISRWQQQRAFTLIELMIAMTIGLVLLTALLAVFLNVSRANTELARTNGLIENGRFAIQLLKNDLIHAGYWGELDFTDTTSTFASPTSIPDPCLVTGWSAAHKDNLLAIPVQGYDNGTGLSTCGVTGVLTTSDVLIVRHANTCQHGAPDCDDGGDIGPHIQVSACHSEVSPEAAYVIESAGTTPTTTSFPLRTKACPTTPVTAVDAPLRKLISHIYYVATSNGQPTLMRVSLENGAYTSPQPFIDGIEHFRVEYGIDENGKNGLPTSASNPADGSPDRFITTAELVAAPPAACNIAGSHCNLLANIVAVKIHVLARNLEPTTGYTDTKTYQLGNTAVNAANDNFKRHVFSSTVRLVNPAGRRETP